MKPRKSEPVPEPTPEPEAEHVSPGEPGFEYTPLTPEDFEGVDPEIVSMFFQYRDEFDEEQRIWAEKQAANPDADAENDQPSPPPRPELPTSRKPAPPERTPPRPNPTGSLFGGEDDAAQSA